MSQAIVVEDVGLIRWITLDRPESKNGITPEIAEALASAIADATGARVIGITGRNGAFCSGLDLRHAAASGAALLAGAAEHLARFQRVVTTITSAPQPVIAVVDGPAAGFGCDLALACDLRVASARAYFQESFTRIGLVPDGGGTWLLPRLVGLSKALELALLADRLDAQQAHALGLVCAVVNETDLPGAARIVAERLATSAPGALARVKRLMRESLGRPFESGLAAEGKAQLECLASTDFTEGLQAFLEKRPPAFSGH